MTTLSKKKRTDQAIDQAGKNIKSGVSYAAEKTKEASHEAIDLTRKARRKVNRIGRRAQKASGELMESAGNSFKKSGKYLKRSA